MKNKLYTKYEQSATPLWYGVIFLHSDTNRLLEDKY